MTSEPALRLPADPLALLEWNDRFRVLSEAGPTPEADIWTLRAALPEIRRAAAEDAVPCPVLHPVAPPAGPVAPPEEGGRALAPWLARVLRTWRFMGTRVYVVGGAAAWLAGLTPVHDDIDLGIVVPGGLLTTQEALWSVLVTLVDELNRARDEHGQTEFVASLLPGILTLFPRVHPRDEDEEPTTPEPGCAGPDACGGEEKVQVILRAFPSLSTLLHGFDLPSSSMAFDGEEVLLTSAAAYACAHRVNVVCPAYRSTTFERRLGKYFKRGVSLAFAHAPDRLLRTLASDGKVALAHLTIRGRLAPGAVNQAFGELTWWDEARAASDYDPAAVPAARRQFDRRHQFRFNIAQVAAVQRGATPIPLIVMAADKLCETFRTRPPTFKDGLPSRMARGGRYERLYGAPVSWVVVDDPSRQYTGSLNPRVEDPAAWYAAPPETRGASAGAAAGAAARSGGRRRRARRGAAAPARAAAPAQAPAPK